MPLVSRSAHLDIVDTDPESAQPHVRGHSGNDRTPLGPCQPYSVYQIIQYLLSNRKTLVTTYSKTQF